MESKRIPMSLENFGKALDKLEELAIKPQLTEVERDSLIHRFEFTVELACKTFKKILEEQNLMAPTPKMAVSGAFKSNWIKDETLWTEMLKDRNRTSHIYDESLANEMINRIRTYAAELRRVYNSLNNEP